MWVLVPPKTSTQRGGNMLIRSHLVSPLNTQTMGQKLAKTNTTYINQNERNKQSAQYEEGNFIPIFSIWNILDELHELQ